MPAREGAGPVRYRRPGTPATQDAHRLGDAVQGHHLGQPPGADSRVTHAKQTPKPLRVPPHLRARVPALYGIADPARQPCRTRTGSTTPYRVATQASPRGRHPGSRTRRTRRTRPNHSASRLTHSASVGPVRYRRPGTPAMQDAHRLDDTVQGRYLGQPPGSRRPGHARDADAQTTPHPASPQSASPSPVRYRRPGTPATQDAHRLDDTVQGRRTRGELATGTRTRTGFDDTAQGRRTRADAPQRARLSAGASGRSRSPRRRGRRRAGGVRRRTGCPGRARAPTRRARRRGCRDPRRRMRLRAVSRVRR